MDLQVRDKIAFVSGGSKGMVREAALILAGDGAKVAIVARAKDAIDETVELIQSRGGVAMGYSADLTSRQAVGEAVQAVRDKWGPPDIAISCVQENLAGNFDDVADDDFEHFFRVYTMSVVYLAREVMPDMKRKGWGRFVAVGSGAAKEPEGHIHHILANVARPGAVAFMKTLSDEVAQFGVTCNTVGPGWIGTDNMYAYLEKTGVSREQVGKFLTMIPAGRVGRPDEIGSTIAYLCSNLAGYISGNFITVDGGKHGAAF